MSTNTQNEGLYHRCKSLLSSLWILISSLAVFFSSGFSTRCKNSFATDSELPMAVVFTAARHSQIMSTKICPLGVGFPRASRIGRNSLDSYSQRNSSQRVEQDAAEDPSFRKCLSISRSSPYISSSSTFDNTTISASISLDSHSLYSSPPSSMIIHTPIITITAPSGETETNCDPILCYDSDEPDEEDASKPTGEQRNMDGDVAKQSDSLCQPILGSLALRRGFQGPPIITSFAIQHVLISPSVLSAPLDSRRSAASNAHGSPNPALLSPDSAYDIDTDFSFDSDSQSTHSAPAENTDFNPLDQSHHEPVDYTLTKGHHTLSMDERKFHGPNSQDSCHSASNIKLLFSNSVSEQEIEIQLQKESTKHDPVLPCSEMVTTKPKARKALSELPGDLSALTDFIEQVPANAQDEEVERRFSFPYYHSSSIYNLKSPHEAANDSPQELASLPDQNNSSSGSIHHRTNSNFSSPLSHAFHSIGHALGSMNRRPFPPVGDDTNSFNGYSDGGITSHASSEGPQPQTTVTSHTLLAEIFDALNIDSSMTNSTSHGSNSDSSYSNDDDDVETVCKGNLVSDSTISWGIAF